MLKVIIRGDEKCTVHLRDWVFAVFEDFLHDFKYRPVSSGIAKLRDNGSVVIASLDLCSPIDFAAPPGLSSELTPVPWEITITEFISDPKFVCRDGYHIELLRLIRNWVESAASHASIVEITLTPSLLDLDTSAAHDFAAMLMTPLKGFSKRHHILRHDDLAEPFFVLLGRDPQAPALLRRWAELRDDCGTGEDDAKIAEARAIADAMEQFKETHPDLGMSEERHQHGLWVQRSENNAD